MRFALWLMALFGIAVAAALFAGNNHATVTLFWAPHRIDLSLNLVLLMLASGFLVLHLALRALAAMFSIPQQARRWRLQQKERAIYTALLDSLSHLVAGRFIRSRKAAELVVSLEESVAQGGESLAHAGRLRTLTHLIAAESAHALQDKTLRDSHFQQSLQMASTRDAQDARDGVHLRAARWALDDRDAAAAVEWLDHLPQGASRRTVALRLRFKAARMASRNLDALETVRLLTKHRAFSESAGKSIAPRAGIGAGACSARPRPVAACLGQIGCIRAPDAGCCHGGCATSALFGWCGCIGTAMVIACVGQHDPARGLFVCGTARSFGPGAGAEFRQQH